MADIATTTQHIRAHYWPLIKSRQTFLLTLTGAAGYLCQSLFSPNWSHFLSVTGSLLLTISGCSVLNMLFDRDIDRMMRRTSQRPLPAGQVKSGTVAYLGGILIVVGLIWAATLSMLYFLVVLAGASLNVLVYTLWLKRRTAWSILWGGIAGAMPILAGRVLAVSRIEILGLLLALVIICWIPSHNLTLTTLYSADYLEAGVPTFLNSYGANWTHLVIFISSLLTAMLTSTAFFWLDAPILILVFISVISIGLIGLALLSKLEPSQKRIAVLYKYSSLYMLVAMLLLIFNGLR